MIWKKLAKRKIIDYYRKNRRFVRFTQEDDATELPDFQTEEEMKGSWKPEYGPTDWENNPMKSLE